MTTEESTHGFFLEAHFVHGLAPIVLQELRHQLRHHFLQLATHDAATLRFALIANLSKLHQVRTVTAFYLGCHYAVPRPKAFLGHAHFAQVRRQLAFVQKASPQHRFRSFRVEAAGADSIIFRRLRYEIANTMRLIDDPVDGELEMRIFPSPTIPDQWYVLCRLTPRPLSVRAWRVNNFAGALNATIAAAMIHLSQPRATDCVLNLFCGSGTLLIERLSFGPTTLAVGCDDSATALMAARENLKAAALIDQVVLHEEDATELSLPPQSFDRLFADLP
jgi:hypothetical protein